MKKQMGNQRRQAGKSLAFTAGMDTKGAAAVLAFGAMGAAIGASTYKGCTPTIAELKPSADRIRSLLL